MVRSREGITQIRSIFFFTILELDDFLMFESSNPISAGSMMSLAICCDLVGGLTWPCARCESVDVSSQRLECMSRFRDAPPPSGK